MVPRETGRRGFLFGVAGLGASGVEVPEIDGLGGSPPAFGVPDTGHSVRWTFAAGEDALVSPVTRADGLVFAVIHRRADDESATEAVALDPDDGTVRWKTAVDEVVAPTAANGLVYVGGYEQLQALDPRDGSRRWRFQRDPYRFRDFVVDGPSVFSAGRGSIVAIDAVEGGTRWTTDVGNDDRLGRLFLGDDSVYVAGERAFYALDRNDGREQWSVETSSDGRTHVEAVHDGLLVGWSDTAAYGIATDEGTATWRTEIEGARPSDSLGEVVGDTVYVWGENLVAIDLRTGDRRWTYESDAGRGYGLRVSDGRLFFPVDGGAFVALDADSGGELWRFEARQLHGYWGGAADGRVYVLGRDAAHVLGAESGRETWRLDLRDHEGGGLWADVVGDLAFVGTRDGTLYAVDRPSPLVTAPVTAAERFATSPTGLGLMGLLAAGLLGAGYRRRAATRAGDDERDRSFGRLDRLGGGAVTETYRKRVRTPDGPRLVAETSLTADADVETRRAFERAVEQWASLDADGVLPILDAGTDPTPWFETPLAADGSLADAWPLERRDRVEVVSGVARALHAAHDEGVVHGRLAPRHVLLDASDDSNARADVRVGGWFLADALADARDAGDPYAPPEASADGAAAGVRGDVYRVAALAHHLLLGELPDPDSTVSQSRSSVPSDELADVLARALAADPADRYDSTLAFDDAFRWAALDR